MMRNLRLSDVVEDKKAYQRKTLSIGRRAVKSMGFSHF